MSDIIAFESEMMDDAISQRASDIHIEPRGTEWEIRIRQEGVLCLYRKLPYQQGIALVQRMKLQGSMDIGEKRLPLDGGFTYEGKGGKKYDLRISSLPTVEGEKCTIRILYRYPEYNRISELGLDANDYERLLRWLEEPMGLILVTGPTGAGKTTTLYAMLQHLNRGKSNISTIEDPVEIRIEGINQVQVNETAGLSFAKGLRALLRQDPDVIMIGEIRDKETAEIVVRAALTGHLVLATLHTMDSETAITRLLEMGIEPYLVTSALKGVISQRMLINPCPACSGKRECSICNGKGFLGRTPSFDLFEVKEEMAPYILSKCPPAELRKIRKQLERKQLPNLV